MKKGFLFIRKSASERHLDTDDVLMVECFRMFSCSGQNRDGYEREIRTTTDSECTVFRLGSTITRFSG